MGLSYRREVEEVRTVITCGCFDRLHPGHVRFLQASKALGNKLVVLLNSDEYILKHKSDRLPLFCFDERKELLEALCCVDEVKLLEFDHGGVWLARNVLPSSEVTFTKGVEYRGSDIPEQRVCRDLDLQFVFVDSQYKLHTHDFLDPHKDL